MVYSKGYTTCWYLNMETLIQSGWLEGNLLGVTEMWISEGEVEYSPINVKSSSLVEQTPMTNEMMKHYVLRINECLKY